MNGIFISYRREDSAGYTGRLFDRLSEQFGKDQIFMDISDIEPGMDFVEAIEEAVSSCDVLIAVIGKEWLNITDASRKRRLDDPEDFVRLEIVSALKRNVRVIPVLIQRAAMPSSKDLSDDLATLSKRQALELSDNRWDYDVNQLIEVLEKVVSKSSQTNSSLKARKQSVVPIRSKPNNDTISKVNFRTWKWEDKIDISIEEAFHLSEQVLQNLGFKMKSFVNPTRITVKKEMTSSLTSLICTGGEEININLEPINDQSTMISVSSRSNQTALIDPLSTNKKNIQLIVEALFATLIQK